MMGLATSAVAAVLVTVAAVSAPSGVAQAAGRNDLSVRNHVGAVKATVVHGPCHLGGSIVLRVDKTSATYVMTATARDLPEGTRWRVAFNETSNTGSNVFEGGVARPVIHNGGWTVSRVVRALPAPEFGVAGFGPGKIDLAHERFCKVMAQPAVPFAGVTACHKNVELAMTAVDRDGAGTVVRWLIVAKPDTMWGVTVTAATADSGAGVSTTRTANRQGLLMGKDTFNGPVNPRLRLQVRTAGGQRCTLAMHRTLARPTPTRRPLLRAYGAPLSDASRFRELLSARPLNPARLGGGGGLVQ
jgi:hypothetical protein